MYIYARVYICMRFTPFVQLQRWLQVLTNTGTPWTVSILTNIEKSAKDNEHPLKTRDAFARFRTDLPSGVRTFAPITPTNEDKEKRGTYSRLISPSKLDFSPRPSRQTDQGPAGCKLLSPWLAIGQSKHWSTCFSVEGKAGGKEGIGRAGRGEGGRGWGERERWIKGGKEDG